MTKRTSTTKLNIYRRHSGTCPIKEATNTANCECAVWVHGKLRGRFIRKSLDTRSEETAKQKVRDMINKPEDDPTPTGMHLVTKPKGEETTLEYAAEAFLANVKKRVEKATLSTNTHKLYTRAVTEFAAWGAKQGLVLLKQIDTPHIEAYFNEAAREWKRSTAQSCLVHLRVFFNYCLTRQWITFPPTKDRELNFKKGKGSKTTKPRMPFTPAEVTEIFAAVERMPADMRDRARALVYLLLFTGMRISDATFFERACLTETNTADYYVIKTRRKIDLPPEVAQVAIDALAKLPPTLVYFFQPDRSGNYMEAREALAEGGEFSTLMPDYEARVRECTKLVLQVLKLASLKGACHRFRDTFAINLLVGDGEKCADIYTVSKMLGHSDVRITDDHYMKLVKGYRERMSQKTRVLSYQFPTYASADAAD